MVSEQNIIHPYIILFLMRLFGRRWIMFPFMMAEISVSAYYPRVYIAGDGGSVSLDNLDNETNLKSLSVLGQLSELSLSGFSGTLDEISLGKFGQVASVVGNDSANIFNIEYTRNYDSVSNSLILV